MKTPNIMHVLRVILAVQPTLVSGCQGVPDQAVVKERHERDLLALLEAKQFESRQIGEEGAPSKLVQSFTSLLQGDSRNEDFIKLAHSSSSAAVAYGLLGLRHIDAKLYDAIKKTIDLEQVILVVVGDRVGQVNLSALLRAAEDGKIDLGIKSKEP
jgi:hypothetical protein